MSEVGLNIIEEMDDPRILIPINGTNFLTMNLLPNAEF
jgi:hypothetical protein